MRSTNQEVRAMSANPIADPPFGLSQIEATRKALAKHLVRTPIHSWRTQALAERSGAAEVVLKLELLQRTGTFKPRGALTVMAGMTADQRARGVTAVSAGNHAIAVAFAAQRLGVSAKVAMPAAAPKLRIDMARSFGAEVLLEADTTQAFARAQALQQTEGRFFVHPFEGPLTALGTASLGLEFHRQAGRLDAVIVAIGGGGLCAGVATALRLLQPKCLIFGVEPAGADTMRQSFVAGEPLTRPVRTIADSLAPPFTLPYSFELCRRALDEIVVVHDEEIVEAMRFLFDDVKLAVEPAGAAATAALLGPLDERLRGARVGVVVCGANIARERFFELTMERPSRS
jgi:threonine dehydratase